MAQFAVNLAVETLGSLIVQEIKLLGSARQGVEDIKLELESIGSFLQDADTRAALEDEEGGSNQGVKTWVKQVREEAYRIEDVIDEYIMKKAKLPHAGGLIGYFHKMRSFIRTQKIRHGIATQINEIKSSLAEIQRRAQSYNFRSIDQGSSSEATNVVPHDSRVGSFFIKDAEVVGIESTRDELIDLLVNGTSKDQSVIVVVGQGGLGKTTLAGKIFNNDAVKKHFDLRAWITVGKGYTKIDLLRTIIQEFCRVTGSAPQAMDKIQEQGLIATLREQLKEKCYMVVFDDVWNIEFWEDVRHALIDNDKSSRVMLTTRNKAVASSIPFVKTHMLQPLPYDKAWELFCRKAFGYNQSCPAQLEKLSDDILAKCGGLPLAIVAVGALLSNKEKIVFEWQQLLRNLGSKLGSDPCLKSCNRVLSEGYYDLPHRLKSCLLYFGLFPENYSVSCVRLIRLWMAEGFVQYSKRSPPEQVAEEYLTELINRGLIQVSERDCTGRVRTCRVHDLMLEIILRKTEELGFCQVLSGEGVNHWSKTRRISIHSSTIGVLNSIEDSKIRSVYFFNAHERLPESSMHSFVADFKLLKVLDFEDAPLEYLPEGVGNLFHLHYLSVRATKVKELPRSIGKLVNLETLDLKRSRVSELPVEINNLKKLRFLIVYNLDNDGLYEGVKIQEGFGSLTSLQKLYFVEVNFEVLKEIKKLRQLRKLGIRLTKENGRDLWAFIVKMEYLESLDLRSASREDILDIQSVASPQNLQRVHLKGNMTKLPEWMTKLESLTRLGLAVSGLTDDPLPMLQALPNLSYLMLLNTHQNEKLHFEEGWFPKLKELRIREFRGLKLVTIDKGVMSNLNMLMIGPCPLLKEIPIGIEHLTNLKTLVFSNMLREVCGMIKDENWGKVTQHIPDIGVIYKVAGQRFYCTSKDLCSLPPMDIKWFIQQVEGSSQSSHL